MSQAVLDKVFAALADPTRRSIVEQLATGEYQVADLARPHAISAPAISKHLRVLESAGFLHRRIEGNKRWCSLDARPFHDIQAWLKRYDGFWDEQLDALVTYVARNRKKPRQKATGPKKSGTIRETHDRQ